MSGLIAVIASDLARYTKFWTSFYITELPERAMFIAVCGPSISRNRNVAMQTALDKNAEWLWMLDDDHVLPPSTLTKLLNRRRDIVVPLILRKRPPFQGVIHNERDPSKDNKFASIALTPDYTGCQRVYAAGTACMLIRKNVIIGTKRPDRPAEPWFDDGLGEDLKFCEHANKMGYSVWVDTDAPVGHITECQVWPVYDKDKWTTEIRIHNIAIPLPAALPIESEDADANL